ncbi:MAG: Rho termination factor N-terminal domain-containing protein, partial [Flavobacteriaceae bacterium]|nr:Rho termination factor N-terminal domain-containing protein [Flavobacteriaceae bacterium]
MFEIESLKEKKLSELQEIAENIGVSKFKQLKKLDLIYQILDIQASKPIAVVQEKPVQEQKKQNAPTSKNRPQRKRINAKPTQEPEVKTTVEEVVIEPKVEEKKAEENKPAEKHQQREHKKEYNTGSNQRNNQKRKQTGNNNNP